MRTHLTDTTVQELKPTVEMAANAAMRRYHQYVDREDMVQTAWLWVFDHDSKVNQWLNEDVENETTDGAKRLYTSIFNECCNLGEDCKAATLGYQRSDLKYFHRNELGALLDAMFDREAWTEPPVNEDGGRKSTIAGEGGNWITTLADCSRAFDLLPERDRTLLAAFHQLGYSNQELAERAGVADSTMSDWHKASLRRLEQQLGGRPPRESHDADCTHVWRGRHSVSNEASRARQSSYYDD